MELNNMKEVAQSENNLGIQMSSAIARVVRHKSTS